MTEVLLKVRSLKTYFFTYGGTVKAVENVFFDVKEGETLGIAGESGCGKSTAALSIMRLVPPPGRIVHGEVILGNEDILQKSDEEVRSKIRWKKISMIFQSAMNSLNPLLTIGDQIVEALLYHENVSKEEALDRTNALLELTGVEASRSKDYPHELSGGMRQRAMIAMALSCNPELLIADEPTTALDVIVQAQVLQLVQRLQRKFKLSMIWISHNMSVIAQICHRLAIMYAGYVVEYGDILTLFKNPDHPYTKALVMAFPDVSQSEKKIKSIPGTPPNLLMPPMGCRFHPRCPSAMDICKKVEPKAVDIGKGHYVCCHLFN